MSILLQKRKKKKIMVIHQCFCSITVYFSQLSFDAALQSFPVAGDYQAHSSTAYPTTTSLLNAATTTGNNNTLQSYFIESNPITPPESTGSGRR